MQGPAVRPSVDHVNVAWIMGFLKVEKAHAWIWTAFSSCLCRLCVRPLRASAGRRSAVGCLSGVRHEVAPGVDLPGSASPRSGAGRSASARPRAAREHIHRAPAVLRRVRCWPGPGCSLAGLPCGHPRARVPASTGGRPPARGRGRWGATRSTSSTDPIASGSASGRAKKRPSTVRRTYVICARTSHASHATASAPPPRPPRVYTCSPAVIIW